LLGYSDVCLAGSQAICSFALENLDFPGPPRALRRPAPFRSASPGSSAHF